MARVHYPTNAGQAWARREAIGGDARLASEVPILLKSRPQCILDPCDYGRSYLLTPIVLLSNIIL